jgi:hypothetical protein
MDLPDVGPTTEFAPTMKRTRAAVEITAQNG